MTPEEIRLQQNRDRQVYWQRWGSYLSERQWGTVREDYSATGAAWDYFPHDHARSRAYRWGEDGIAGISDNHQRLCLAIAMWNGRDSILKERLFGLTGTEGNHGEDVKEYYFYLDNTPTHAYMKYLYKYPQTAFPYSELVAENRNRSRHAPEYELLDTGIFQQNRYFDIVVEYAKVTAEDILLKISVTNRSTTEQKLHLLPTIWFRNTWSWTESAAKPLLKVASGDREFKTIEAFHQTLGTRWLYCGGTPQLLFTENETNTHRLFGVENCSPYVKDGIGEYIVNRQQQAINPQQKGTKASAYYLLSLAAGERQTIQLRLSDSTDLKQPFAVFDDTFKIRIAEADAFYHRLNSVPLSEDLQNIQRQAWAGLLWNKQYYHYDVSRWLKGDPAQPPPPEARQQGRNRRWQHLYSDDILSMPDKWEYPWFAAWDLAFHTVSLAAIDPDFAKLQLSRLTREWYLHPNGQLPAYEWAFDDVNPPVHAWAVMQVYQIERKIYDRCDRHFLERVFQKLLLNFTWWVNREDKEGSNVFEGGFLGLDNISLFDRSQPLPTGGYLQQADGTSWMAMYCLNMLEIALELTQYDPVYEDIASKFFEHFIYIADATNNIGIYCSDLWDEEDKFFYDLLNLPDGQHQRLRIRSLVGLIPLLAVTIIPQKTLDRLPDFKRRVTWFLDNRPELARNIAYMEATGVGEGRLLSLVTLDKLEPILKRMLDEAEFLSPYGIRSLSRYHAAYPYSFDVNGETYRIDYEPAESTTTLFGGNSNWRGPVWLPINYLIIQALQKFDSYLGDKFTVPFPSHSSNTSNLQQIARFLAQRAIAIFLTDSEGKRPVYGGTKQFHNDSHWQNLILFYEYFHGDNGAGIGASHQTGWTSLVAKLIQDLELDAELE